MKKRIEHEELLADVLADDEQCRAAILERGLVALRRTRARRRVARLTILGITPLFVVTAMLVLQNQRNTTTRIASVPNTSPVVQTAVPRMIEGTPIRVLTDDELLAFFKDRPVALMGGPG